MRGFLTARGSRAGGNGRCWLLTRREGMGGFLAVRGRKAGVGRN